MRFPGRKAETPFGVRIAGLIAETLGTLRDTQRWVLTPTQWQEVDQIVATIESAVGSRDIDTLRQAGGDLNWPNRSG
jgi:hypothetical protein